MAKWPPVLRELLTSWRILAWRSRSAFLQLRYALLYILFSSSPYLNITCRELYAPLSPLKQFGWNKKIHLFYPYFAYYSN